MTNEELKKKLAEIINEWHKFQKRDAHGNTIWQTNDAEKLANAFISAGIGDVKEAEHRAEVAERAVKELKAREQSVVMGTEWKAVVTDEDIDEVFGICNPDGEAKNDGTQND